MKNWKLLNKKGEIIDSINAVECPRENYVEIDLENDFINPISKDGKTFIEGAKEAEINDFITKKINDLNNQFKIEMEDTDGYVYRYIETGEEIPADISELRKGLRQKYDNLKNEIKK